MRPWLRDIVIGICFIVVIIGAMAMLGKLADICSYFQWCV